MSGTIHMETERMHELVRKLEFTAMELEDSTARINSASMRLSAAWQGPHAAAYLRSLAGWQRRFTAHVNDLGRLSQRVWQETEEWQTADARFGAGLPALAVAIQTGSDIFPWVEKGVPALGMAYYLSKGYIRSGGTYAGQVKFYSGASIKEHFLGVSGSLTHIKATNVPAHLLQQGTNWSPKTLGGAVKWVGAGLDFGDKAIQSWQRYDKGGERAGALAYDLAFVAAKAVASPYVQYAVATVAVAGLTAVGAPAVLVAGGALAAWWVGGVAWDWAADQMYDFSLRVGVQDAFAGATRSVADAASSVFNQAKAGAGKAADWAQGKAQEAAGAVDSAFSQVKNNISSLGKAFSFGF